MLIPCTLFLPPWRFFANSEFAYWCELLWHFYRFIFFRLSCCRITYVIHKMYTVGVISAYPIIMHLNARLDLVSLMLKRSLVVNCLFWFSQMMEKFTLVCTTLKNRFNYILAYYFKDFCRFYASNIDLTKTRKIIRLYSVLTVDHITINDIFNQNIAKCLSVCSGWLRLFVSQLDPWIDKIARWKSWNHENRIASRGSPLLGIE